MKRVIFILLFAGVLAGCGQTGPLTLPHQQDAKASHVGHFFAEGQAGSSL